MYTPLYIKSENSLLSSMINIDSLIEFAKKNGIESLTITDNNMYGVMEFYHKCLDNNIKPIVGLEVTLDGNKFLLYCINYNGYKNLIKIATSLSDTTISYDLLEKYNDDLLCIVSFESINNLYSKLESIFRIIYKGYKNLSEREKLSGDNLIYLNEILYLNKRDSVYYKYLLGIRDGLILEQVHYEDNNYLLTLDEIKALYPIDLQNNYKITELCNLKLEFNLDLLPIYDCPNNIDSFHYLKQLSIDGLKRLFGDEVSKKYIDRLKYELDIINKMEFCNYFLVVYDYVRFAKESGILVGPGRGSAAGSLVSYCLNITTIDPIKYDLLFERFLNPERISMPDIDIDFEYDRREEVIDYCRKKYGNKKAAPIITFGTLGAKQVVRDVGRVMDIDLNIVDNLAKLLDSRLSLKENYNKNIKIKNLLNINKELFNLYKIATKFEGFKRHKTIHAAGVVMSKYDLDEIIPLDMHTDGFYLTGYSMEYLEEIGLLKMDFLALRNLSTITDILKQINENEKINLTFDNIPLNDKEAINIFTNCYTLGIFQFESTGMMNFIRKFKPDCLDDIIASLALFRPGPMKNIDTYIKRKRGLEPIDYLHPNLVEILKPTNGIIVYQEQIMQIAVKLAGYSLGEADVLRKAMSKKKGDVLLAEKDKFIDRSVNRGYDYNIASKVFDFILRFAEYGFNKAHSVAYGVIAYKMAYLKAHYKEYFMKSLLSSVMGSEIKTKDYIYECKLLGINLLSPDINLSTDEYVIDKKSLRYPLSGIRNIGGVITTAILNERKHGQFIDIFDFVKRMYGKSINRKSLQTLNHAGCLVSFGLNKRTIDENLDLIINYGEIGELLDNDESLKPVLNIAMEYSNKELMKYEFEVFGFYLSKHPVTEYKIKFNTVNLETINNYFDKFVDIIAYVDKLKIVKTKNNEEMCFITGSDEVTNLDIVLFPNLYEIYNNIEVGDIIKVNGKVERRFDKYQLVVNKLEIIE
ncbi:MAG: DNA polymerase III subunit alpha [Bacilli bacterium]|nr:DNA polymerase III subunit alpha [Bacilli bacterium]